MEDLKYPNDKGTIDFDDVGQESDDDLKGLSPDQFRDAVLWGTDWTTETVLNQLRKKNIQLNPRFQRRDAWDEIKKSKFIESLILGLPVPPIILAESKDKRGAYIVIDGKQRLLSIMQFSATENDTGFKKLYLKGIEILPKSFKKKNYEEITSDNEISDYLTQYDNQAIRTVVIRNWPDEKFLFTVFYRLNTGSLKLSSQELRQALHPGPFIDFADDFSSKPEIQETLGLSKPDSRMRDVEIIIRYFAFKNFLKEYTGNLKIFLDESCKNFNKNWEVNKDQYEEQGKQLLEAINLSKKIFTKKNVFNKYQKADFTGKFNRPVFDIMVYYFSDPQIRKLTEGKENAIKEKFIELCKENEKFFESFGSSTKDKDKTTERYRTWGKELGKILNYKIDHI